MTIFVDSNKTGGSDNGNSQADAYLTFQQALDDGGALSEDIFIHVGASSPHKETYSSDPAWASTQAESIASPIKVFGVDFGNSNAFVSKPSAAVFQINAGIGFSIDLVGVAFHGLNIKMDNGSGNFDVAGPDNSIVTFYDSIIDVGQGLSSSNDVSIGGRLGMFVLENTDFHVGDQITSVAGTYLMRGGSLTVETTPNIAFVSDFRKLLFDGVDLSGMTSGDTIISAGNRGAVADFNNCDMPASWTAYSGTITTPGIVYSFNNCDDSGEYARTEKYWKAGDIKTDTAVYITTGGWADETGNSTAVPLSQKMTPTTSCEPSSPLDSFPIDEYLDTTGSKTFTVELIDDFETTLQDDEVWLEIFYHATSGQVKQSVGASRVIPGDTVANLSAGTGTGNWTGEPASSRSVKLAVTVTTGNIGWYSAVVRLAKYEANGADTNPGAALYVAPLLTIS